MEKVFGKRLRELRKEKGLLMKDVAKDLGIGLTTLAGYENNEREPNFLILVKLCRYYNVSADYLLGLTDF